MERVATPVLPQNEVREDWSVQNCHFQIEIRPEAVDQIKTEIIRGLKALPKRGTEIGGILFGTLTKTETEVTIEVEHVLAVTTEYKFGPSFRLSENDEKTFSRSILAWPDRTPIGWYRSNTRPTREALSDDHALTSKYFPGTGLFLFLKPDFTGEIGATAHIAGFDAHDFDFGRFSFLDQLLNSATEEEDPDSVPAVFDAQGRVHSAVATIKQQDGLAPASLRSTLPKESLSRTTTLSTIAAAAVCIAFAGWLALHKRPAIAPVVSSDKSSGERLAPLPTLPSPTTSASADRLDLRAEYQGSGLMVRWNRDAPSIITASGADFTLEQGSSKRTVQLDPATLRSGGLLLRPNSADLNLGLSVHSPLGDASQTLRVIGSSILNAPTNAALRGDIQRPAAAASAPIALGAKSSAPSLVPLATNEPLKVAEAKPQEQKAPEVRTPELKLPEPKPTELKQADTRLANNRVAETKPAASVPQPELTWEPLPQRMQKLTATLPAMPPPPVPVPSTNLPTAGAYVDRVPIPPKAIRTVQPQPPENIKTIKNTGADVYTGQSVTVEVSIDEHGVVTGAEVVKTSGALARLFEKNSLIAARQWRFEPARLGSQTVPAKQMLTFKFTPHGR